MISFCLSAIYAPPFSGSPTPVEVTTLDPRIQNAVAIGASVAGPSVRRLN